LVRGTGDTFSILTALIGGTAPIHTGLFVDRAENTEPILADFIWPTTLIYTGLLILRTEDTESILTNFVRPTTHIHTGYSTLRTLIDTLPILTELVRGTAHIVTTDGKFSRTAPFPTTLFISRTAQLGLGATLVTGFAAPFPTTLSISRTAYFPTTLVVSRTAASRLRAADFILGAARTPCSPTGTEIVVTALGVTTVHKIGEISVR
jgi:hypothetical protein